MEQLSPVQKMKFKNMVEHILHVPGNFTKGILEMTIVIDCHMPKEQVEDIMPALLKALKMQGEVFRNVRLNLTYWQVEDKMKNQVTPMMVAMSKAFYKDYCSDEGEKNLVNMLLYLKKFHARSKLIILLTNDIADETFRGTEVKTAMQPFLGKKFMQVIYEKEEIQFLGYQPMA